MSFSSYVERKYITIAPEPFIKYTFRVRFLHFFSSFLFPVIRISFSCADYFNNIRHGDEFSTSKLVQLCKICCSSLFCIYFSTLVLIPLSRLRLLLVVSTIKVVFLNNFHQPFRTRKIFFASFRFCSMYYIFSLHSISMFLEQVKHFSLSLGFLFTNSHNIENSFSFFYSDFVFSFIFNLFVEQSS